jgi:hypothetical protein
VLNAYYSIFKDQYIGLSLGFGLAIDNGTTGTSSAYGQAVATPSAIITASEKAAAKNKRRSLLQEDSIMGSAGPPFDPDSYNSVEASCGHATTGFQDDITIPSTKLAEALQNVLAGNAQYWEVPEWEVTGTTGATGATTLYAANEKDLPTATKACAPLTLHSNGYELTAATDIDLSDSGLQINIDDGKTPLGGLSCGPTGETCTTTVAGPGSYTADVGGPGATPYGPQALVSATTDVIKAIKPTCKPSTSTKPSTCM